jgi:hypothetical protein
VLSSPSNPANWHALGIFNNIMVNNVTGLAGAIALQDAAKASIVNNTIAHNDSTATASDAFGAGPSVSTPQVAGIASRAHTLELLAAMGAGAGPNFAGFSNPELVNNIIWQNRSFHWDVAQNGGRGGLLPLPADPPVFSDMAVLGTPTAQRLDPRSGILTDTTGYHASNQSVDPLFGQEYFNGNRSYLVTPGPNTGMETTAALDEGGNFIDVRYGPLTLTGDYHLTAGSPLNTGSDTVLAAHPELATDIDGQPRPSGAHADAGADEVQQGAQPLAATADADGDGIPDQRDNCVLAANPAQIDSDGDGYGNICDGDFNNDGATNTADLMTLRAAFGSSMGQTAYHASVDLDGNGAVNMLDMSLFKGLFGKAPGPSGLVP